MLQGQAEASSLLKAFSKLMATLNITPHTPVALALSGGADSTALAVLASRWSSQGSSAPAQQPQSRSPFAIVIDHNLREASAQEAQCAVAIADSLGMQTHVQTLSWPGGPPRHGISLEAARAARYQALVEQCQAEACHVLMTAHHAGDQAEGFIIRLSRASGVDGLAGLAVETHLTAGGWPVRLVRPLLDLHKYQLEQVCRDAGLTWVQDPTNHNLNYTRNLLRKHLQSSACSTAGQKAWPHADFYSLGQATPHRGSSFVESGKEQGDCLKDTAPEGVGPSIFETAPGHRGLTSAPLQEASQYRQAKAASSNIWDLSRAASAPVEIGLEEEGISGKAHAGPCMPQIVRDVLRLSSACRAAKLELHNRARALLDAAVQTCGENQEFALIAVAPLATASQPVAMRALGIMMQRVAGSYYPLQRKAVARLCSFVRSGKLKKSHLVSGFRIDFVRGAHGLLMKIAK